MLNHIRKSSHFLNTFYTVFPTFRHVESFCFSIQKFCFNFDLNLPFRYTRGLHSRGGSRTAATSKMELFVILVNPIHHGLFKNDQSMKLPSQKHVSFASIVCLFSCLVCVTWYDYDVIYMINPCKLCILTYNSICLPKVIWSCLHWCDLCILSQSLLYLKQKNSK